MTTTLWSELGASPFGGEYVAESPFAADAGESPAYRTEVAGLPLAHESPEQSTVRQATAAGTTDVNTLTDMVFFARHPERNRRALSAAEPGFAALAAEWTAIRDTVVRPLLTASPPPSSAPGTGTGMWVPGAERLPNARSAGGTYVGGVWRFVFHTIEGEPSAQGFRTLAAGHANPPHLWAMPSADLLLQTVPLDRSAYALARPGSIQTNRQNAIQVEVHGFAAKMVDATPATLAWLAERVLAPVARLLPINLEQVSPRGPGEPCYGRTSSCRMSADDWMTFNGVTGHNRVPDNEHWDPGQLDLAAIAARARAIVGGGTGRVQREHLADHDGPGFEAERDDEGPSCGCRGGAGTASEAAPLAQEAAPWAQEAAPWAQESPEEVRWIQTRLNQLIGAGLVVDGTLGPLTRAAIMDFQRRQGLVVDGIVGPITRAALDRTSWGSPPAPPAPPAPSPPSAPSAPGRPATVGLFDGKEVATWLIPYLTWARQNGWQGRLNSGWRSPEHSEQICFGLCQAPSCPGTCAGRSSNHSGDVKPRGAIDVTDHVRFGELMARAPFSPRILNNLPNDRIHFSATGG